MLIRINISSGGKSEFTQLLRGCDIAFAERQPQLGTISASISTLEVTTIVGTLTPFAGVLIAWLNNRARRKVIVQTKANQLVSIEGYSRKDVSSLLDQAVSLNVIQTDKD